MNNKTRFLLTAVAAAILSGCGSSGGSSGNWVDPTTPTVPGDGGSGPGDGGGTDPGTGGGTDPGSKKVSGLQAVGVDKAQAQGLSGKGVDVAVLDSGFYSESHTDEVNVVDNKRYGFGVGEVALADGTYQLIDTETHTAHGRGVVSVLAGDYGVAKDINLHVADVTRPDGSISTLQVGQTLSKLSQDGIKIFNLSLNAAPYNPTTNKDQVAGFAKGVSDVVGNGGLIVMSTGNDGADQPGLNSMVPLDNSDLQKGFITVSAVKGDGTFDYSGNLSNDGVYNKCGAAADWCLVAPDGYKISDDGSVSRYFTETSAAAPVVSGVAALLAEKYPWASNDFLRHSILTTATDLGDKDTYGWGLLNADKALGGPSSLPFNDLVLNVPSSSYELSNDISGQYGLVKQGEGTIVLSGNNTFAGDSIVNAGTYVVNGSVAGVTNVKFGGAIAGSGSFGKVNNSGLVVVHNSDLNVKGDFNQDSTGSLDVSLGNKLVVDGVANLDGGLVVNTISDGYVSGQGTVDEKVLTADLVLGQFANTNLDNLLLVDASVKYGFNNVSVEATRVNVQNAAEKLSAQGYVVSEQSVKNLEAIYQGLDNNVAGLRDNQEVLDIASKLQGVDSASSLASTMQAMDANIYANNIVANRLQLSHANHLIKDGLGQSGAFLSITNGDGKFKFGQGSKLKSNTVVLGNNIGLNADYTLGVGLVLQEAKVEEQYGKSKNTNTGIFTSLQYGSADQGYVRGVLAGYKIDNSTNRYVDVAGDVYNVKGDADAYLISADVNVGKKFGLFGSEVEGGKQQFSVLPNAGLLFTHQRSKAFNEVGANGLSYDFDRVSQNMTTLYAGVDALYELDNKFGNSFVKAYFDVEYDLGNNKDVVANIAGTGITFDSARSVPKTRYSAGLGANYQVSKSVNVGARYDRQFASKYNQNYFNLNVSYQY